MKAKQCKHMKYIREEENYISNVKYMLQAK